MKTKTTDKPGTQAHALLTVHLDLVDWRGDQGGVVRIATRGDPADERVDVSIKNVFGAVLEQGPATYDDPSGSWRYVTTAVLPSAEVLKISAMVTSSKGTALATGAWVPYHLHLATEFKSAPWAYGAGRGLWRNN